MPFSIKIDVLVMFSQAMLLYVPATSGSVRHNCHNKSTRNEHVELFPAVPQSLHLTLHERTCGG